MKHKVNDRIFAIEEQLKIYPDPPMNPEMEIMGSLTVFSREVKDRVQQQEFLSQWDVEIMERFKKGILSLKPKYNVRDSPRGPPPSPEVINLCDDSPPSARSSPVIRKRTAPNSDQISPFPKRQRPVSTSPVKAEGIDLPGLWSAAPTYRGVAPRPATKTLADIRKLIRRNATPGQPGLVSASVYQPMYTEAARGWIDHLQEFVKATLDFLQGEIISIMDSSFGNLKNTSFYKESEKHMLEFINNLRMELGSQLGRLFSLESQRLFTKDEESLERNKRQEKKVLGRHRHHYRWAAQNGDDRPAIRRVEELTEEELAQEAIAMQKQMSKMLPDPFEPELSVAAYVRGYYLTAANRFIDNVAIHVMSGLFPDVARVIDKHLHEKLGLAGSSASKFILSRDVYPVRIIWLTRHKVLRCCKP